MRNANARRLGQVCVALGSLGLVLAACGNEAAQEQQGLAFRSLAGVGPCGLESTTITVYPSGYWDGTTDENGEYTGINNQIGPFQYEGAPAQGTNVEPQQVGEVDDLDLGGISDTDAPIEGVYWITDWFQLLPVGSYDVVVTINGSQPMTQIHNDIQVFAGQTTEDTFIFECDGTTIQGLDIVVLVNEGPSIVSFEYEDGKFHKVCGENCMTAGFQAGTDGEQMTVYWEAFPHDTSGAPLNYPGPHDDDATDTDAPSLWDTSETIITAGTSTGCFVCEQPGTYDIWVTVKNPAGQITQFQTIAHCDAPAVGYCDAGDPTGVVAVPTCNPDDVEPLDQDCASEYLASAPTCFELAETACGFEPNDCEVMLQQFPMSVCDVTDLLDGCFANPDDFTCEQLQGGAAGEPQAFTLGDCGEFECQQQSGLDCTDALALFAAAQPGINWSALDGACNEDGMFVVPGNSVEVSLGDRPLCFGTAEMFEFALSQVDPALINQDNPTTFDELCN